MRSLAPTVLISLCLVSCGSSDSSGSENGSDGGGGSDDGGVDSSGDDGGDDGSATGSGGDGSGSDGGSEGGTDDGGGPDGPVAAKGGIVVTKVIADQGISVPIGIDGMGTGSSERPVQLIQNRATLIRAEFDVPDGWVPRELKGRITIEYPDGTSEAATQNLLVEADSVPAEIDGQFFWYLPAELVAPGVEYVVELEETEAGHENEPDGAVPPRMPHQGTAPVGIEDTYMVMKVLLIPVKHDLPGRSCSEAPVPTDAHVEAFRSGLFAMNPAEEVQIQVRDTFTWTQPMTEFNPLLSALSQLRSSDGAPPELYYYGLVRPCDGGPMNVGGQAIGIPMNPTMGNAWQRTSLGRFNGTVNSGVSTFVHEVGHTQGRLHIACSGEGGVDPSYPYSGGDIGTFGFDIENWTLMSPNLKDYMTYCGPAWVSDWGWRKVFPIIETLSSWDMGDGGHGQPGLLLVGAVYPDGSDEWWTTSGELLGAEHTPGASVVYNGDAGELSVPALVALRPDGKTLNVAAALPNGVASDLRTVTLRPPGGAHERAVSAARIRWIARR